MPRSMSACTWGVRPPALRGSGTAVPAGADRAAFDHQVPADAGRASGPGPGAVHRAREAHDDQADLGPVALGQPRTSSARRASRSSPTRPMPAACAIFLEEEMGLPCTFSFAALRRPQAGQRRGAPGSAGEDAAGDVRAATTSAMYLSEIGARAMYIPASFPGRDHPPAHRHPRSWGYAGATYLIQEVCNALFDALFHILPLGTEMDAVDAPPRPAGIRSCPGTTTPGASSTSWSRPTPS